MAPDRFEYCTRDEGFVPTISALLAAGIVRRNSGVCAIAFKLAPTDAGDSPRFFWCEFEGNRIKPRIALGKTRGE